MNLLKKRRTRSASASVFALTLGAFLTVGVIAGPAAQALVTCTFSAGGVINVTSTATETTEFQVNAPTQQIWVNGAACVGPGGTALLTNTTAINLTGANLLDQRVDIRMEDSAGDLVDWGTINWTLSVGTEATVAPGDNLRIVGVALVAGDDLDVALGASGIDLNNDGDLDVTISGFDTYNLQGGAGDDTINAAGSTATGAAFADDLTSVLGGAGDDTLAGGAGNDTIDGEASTAVGDTVSGGLGDDILNGGAGASDAVDYSDSATAVTVLLPTPATGEGLDTLGGFEDVIGSAQGDNITGDAGANRIKPGAGDDTVNGGAGVDTYDVQDATDGVTVDLNAGTSTGGSGTDTLSAIENVDGSQGGDDISGDENANVLEGNDGNDTLQGGAGDGSQADGEDGDDTFDGGGGIDTLDYGDNTLGTDVNLTGGAGNGVGGESDTIVANTIENVIAGSGDDTVIGSVFNNIVWPNGGQNSLTGGDGIDTVNYSTGYTAGITINLSGGGASGGGQDSIGGFENAVGTAFNDKIFGTDVVAGTNGANLLVGGKGSDQISANAGPDFVRAGAGNDRVRGGTGDDTILGQGGKDNIRGAGGDDDINGGKGKDFCNGGAGNDFIKKCERPRHNGQGPNGPGRNQRI